MIANDGVLFIPFKIRAVTTSEPTASQKHVLFIPFKIRAVTTM